jgi:predicted nucleic acid-binding protein
VTPVVLDADAFLCLRALGLLEPVLRSPSAPKPTVVLLGYVANNELHDVTDLVRALEDTGALSIERVLARSPESRAVRHLRQRHRIHKGEAEAIAWLISRPEERIPFVSCDGGARRAAVKEKLQAWTVVDLACCWVELGLASSELCDNAFQAWVDDPHAPWRTPGFTTFAAELSKRRPR